MQGSADAASTTVVTPTSSWQLVNGDLETAVQPAGGGDAVAWFPAAMKPIATHPCGRTWAGSVRSHLYLIRLEGGLESTRLERTS